MLSGTEQKPNPCEARLSVFLRALSRPVAPYTPRPKKARKAKPAKAYHPPVEPRRSAIKVMGDAAGTDATRRRHIRRAMKVAGISAPRNGRFFTKVELVLIAEHGGLWSLSDLRDHASRLGAEKEGRA